MTGKKIKLLFLILFLNFSLVAQHATVFNSFKSNLKRADQFYKDQAYDPALELYKKVLNKDTNSNAIKLKMAHCLRMLNRQIDTEAWYEAMILNSEEIQAIDKYYYAEALLSNGKLDDARKWFDEYSNEYSSDSRPSKKKEAISLVAEHYEDSLHYQICEVPFNSSGPEFSPAYYKNGIVFLSSRDETTIIENINLTTSNSFLDLYYSSMSKDGSLSAPQKFDNSINSKFHEGPVTFFDNGNKIIFTKNSDRKGKSSLSSQGVNHLMLFYAEWDSLRFEWKNCIPLPFNNPEYSISHPTFCSESNTLFFASDMPDGFGGTDIYSSKFIHGLWSDPINLGKEINTEGNEMFPYMYKDSVLYFSSNGHGGLGGLDIFCSPLKEGMFYEVKNMGYPLNSNTDDFGMIMSDDGSEGYFSSNRKNGKGDDDIYYFKLHFIQVEGIVEDKVSGKPLDLTTLTIFENDIEKELATNKENGKFYFNLKPGKAYLIQAKKEGYKVGTIEFSTKDSRGMLNTKIALIKENRAFVKGILKDASGALVKDCKVRIINSSGKEQVLLSNEKGEFVSEVDGDDENIFIAEKDGAISIEKLKAQKRKKGSVVSNLYMRLEEYMPFEIRGTLKSEETSLPLSGYEVMVRNEVTKENFFVCSDENGRFVFKAFSYGNYSIILNYRGKKGVLEGIISHRDVSVEVIWSDK